MPREQAGDYSPVSHGGRRRLPMVMLVCIALAIIVLVGGSVLWLLRSETDPPGNAVAATPTATATNVPTWLPTEVTPPVESLFYDTFLNNSHGWGLTSEGGFFRILVDNMLILSNTNSNSTLVESVPTSVNLDDYVVSVDFTIDRGSTHDSAGLYLRGDSTLDHDYRVDINGNNTIDIAKEWLDSDQNPQTTILSSPRHDKDLRPPGNLNTLSVIMIGPSIIVSVNNLVVATVEDSSYTSGQVALFTHNGVGSPGMIVAFSRVEIDHLASPLQTPVPTLTSTPAT